MRIFLIILTLAIVVFSLSCSMKSNKTIDHTPIKNVDLKKYPGTRYEIARFDHRFEKGLTGVTARYTTNEDGSITVLNQGYKDSLSGKLKRAVGKAKIPDKNANTNLRVSFFWIFYADYTILALDTADYQWSLVGSSSDNYLWILSRKPQLSDETYN